MTARHALWGSKRSCVLGWVQHHLMIWRWFTWSIAYPVSFYEVKSQMKICDLWVWQPEPVIVTVSGQRPVARFRLSKTSFQVLVLRQQLKGPAYRGYLLMCCTIKRSFHLIHLKARRLRTKRTRPPVLRAWSIRRHGHDSEKWKHREQDHVCPWFLMYNFIQVEDLNQWISNPCGFTKLIGQFFPQEMGVIERWKQFVFPW